LIITEPNQPPQPTRNDILTSDTKVSVNYPVSNTNPQNGGSSITSIALYWDQGLGDSSWTELVGYSTISFLSTFTVSNGIIQSTFYKFKFKAINIMGSG